MQPLLTSHQAGSKLWKPIQVDIWQMWRIRSGPIFLIRISPWCQRSRQLNGWYSLIFDEKLALFSILWHSLMYCIERWIWESQIWREICPFWCHQQLSYPDLRMILSEKSSHFSWQLSVAILIVIPRVTLVQSEGDFAFILISWQIDWRRFIIKYHFPDLLCFQLTLQQLYQALEVVKVFFFPSGVFFLLFQVNGQLMPRHANEMR